MEGEKRKLIKFSNYSLCVTLPKWVIKELKWKKGDVVDMDVNETKGEITISKGKKTKQRQKVAAQKTSRPSHTGSTLRW